MKRNLLFIGTTLCVLGITGCTKEADEAGFLVGKGTATTTGGAINASVSMKQAMSIIKLNITNASGKVIGVKLTCAEALFATTATVTPSTAAIASPGTQTSELSMNVTDNTDGTTKAVSGIIESRSHCLLCKNIVLLKK